MTEASVFLLVLISSGVGLGIGLYSKRLSAFIINLIHSKKDASKKSLEKKLSFSFTQLFDDQSDASIKEFLSSLEVNSETLTTHLSLAESLRSRGDVGHAVLVHQNLLVRPSLSLDEQNRVRLELAIDFYRSGLMDRAEELLKALCLEKNVNSDLRVKSGSILIELYEELGDWLAAVDIADQLTAEKFSDKVDLWRKLQSQYSCEIAEAALLENDPGLARRWLHSAVHYNPENPRAYLLQAQYYFGLDDHQAVVASLKNIPQHCSSYTPEILQAFKRSFSLLGEKKDLLSELMTMYSTARSLSVLREIFLIQAEVFGKYEAIELVSKEWMSLEGFEACSQLLQFYLEESPKSYSLSALFSEVLLIFDRSLNTKKNYECQNCGFSGHEIHWHCPSCKSWGTVMPLV